MVIDFITTPIWKALKAEISRATGEEQDIRETSVADASYDSSGKTIDFYNVFGDELASIDATDFIKDGMVDGVSLSGNILTIVFNTDAGKEAIDIDLTEFIDPANYYNKFEVDGIVSGVNSGIEIDEKVIATALVDLNDKITNNTFVESDDVDNIAKISQTDYDALTTKNPRTLYMIYE